MIKHFQITIPKVITDDTPMVELDIFFEDFKVRTTVFLQLTQMDIIKVFDN